MGEYCFRSAVPEDSEQLLAIYSRYVTETTVTFEYDVPTVEMFAERIRRITQRFPWIVCEKDGIAVGYAYASEYRERAAFRWSCELSVYVADGCQGMGIGKMLYTALFDVLRCLGYRTACACITYPNETSEPFHRSLGFEQVGIFQKVGYKMGAWRDVVWYQLSLAEYSEEPDLPVTVNELSESELECILNLFADKLN